MSLRLKALNAGLRLIARRYLAHVREPENLRRSFARTARLYAPVPWSWLLDDRLTQGRHSVKATWAMNRRSAGARVILYFHGGGYIAGTPQTHARLAARLAQLTGMHLCLPDYRLAPENPFPAAVDDAFCAYRTLLQRGYPPDRIVLGGDSAGGGLMFALLHLIGRKGLGWPGRVFAFSPWTDLTLSRNAAAGEAVDDPLLPAERMAELRDMYLQGADPDDPRASPLLGEFAGAPPVMIQVGSNEILLDDSRLMAAHLRGQGVEVRLDVWPGAPHVWQMFHGRLPEADRALSDLAGFLGADKGAGDAPAGQPR